MKIIELVSSQVDEIVPVDFGKNSHYGEETALKGQTYSNYRYNGVVFTVNDINKFGGHLEVGKLAKVKLTLDEETGRLGFDSCLTIEQVVNRRNSDYQLAELDAKIASVKMPSVRRAVASEIPS